MNNQQPYAAVPACYQASASVEQQHDTRQLGADQQRAVIAALSGRCVLVTGYILVCMQLNAAACTDQPLHRKQTPMKHPSNQPSTWEVTYTGVKQNKHSNGQSVSV